MLANSTVVLILQYPNTSDQLVVNDNLHNVLCQEYIN